MSPEDERAAEDLALEAETYFEGIRILRTFSGRTLTECKNWMDNLLRQWPTHKFNTGGYGRIVAK